MDALNGIVKLPPLPDGAIGWNVCTPGGTFLEFVGDEDAVGREAQKFASEVEAFAAGSQ